MNKFFNKKILTWLAFTLIFIILGSQFVKTFLIIDDINFVFPSYTHDYLNTTINYIKNFGLFRPVALIYYFFVYEIFVRIPWLAHLIPLLILICSGIILNKLLRIQKLSSLQSLAIPILLLALPFNVESVAWLSANMSIIVILIFFVQIYLIEKTNDKKYSVIYTFLLQLISIFFYESTLFLSISLSFLLAKKYKVKKTVLGFLSFFPILAYYLSKVVFSHQLILKDKLIGLNEAINNWNISLNQLYELFFSNYFWEGFWKRNIIDGLTFYQNNIWLLILIITFLGLILKVFMMNQNQEVNVTRYDNSRFNFWLLSFFLSLIPLSWVNYLSFRILVLPTIIGIINLFLLFNLFIKNRFNKLFNINNSKLFVFTFIILIFVFITIQISMINKYVIQYQTDKKIAVEIDNKLRNLGFLHPYRSNLYIKNLPINIFNQEVYGEFLYGIFTKYWTAEAFLDLHSGSFGQVMVEVPGVNYNPSRLSKPDFLKLRPLTVMRYTDNTTCLKNNCLIIEDVIK